MLKDLPVFTAQEVECIKPRAGLLLCLPSLIGWKVLRLILFKGKTQITEEEEKTKKGVETAD